ncbi:MAG: hypothetical protein Q8P18_22185 [Pseudomonadota bacterium]|nr:hypothetical protein [Pseudomonadota bacterium]
MRLVSSVFALAVLGCCFGPSVDAPPVPAPVAPSPLSQALQGMGAADPAVSGASAPVAPPGAPPAAPAAAPPEALPDAPPVAPASALTPVAAPGVGPACAEAQAAREAVRAELRDLRLTVGGDSTARLEAAGAAMMACNREPDCVRDMQARAAKVDAFDRARQAQAAETTRLAQAEVGLYEADNRVVLACGAP